MYIGHCSQAKHVVHFEDYNNSVQSVFCYSTPLAAPTARTLNMYLIAVFCYSTPLAAPTARSLNMYLIAVFCYSTPLATPTARSLNMYLIAVFCYSTFYCNCYITTSWLTD
jgi:hypothetical protein